MYTARNTLLCCSSHLPIIPSFKGRSVGLELSSILVLYNDGRMIDGIYLGQGQLSDAHLLCTNANETREIPNTAKVVLTSRLSASHIPSYDELHANVSLAFQLPIMANPLMVLNAIDRFPSNQHCSYFIQYALAIDHKVYLNCLRLLAPSLGDALYQLASPLPGEDARTLIWHTRAALDPVLAEARRLLSTKNPDASLAHIEWQHCTQAMDIHNALRPYLPDLPSCSTMGTRLEERYLRSMLTALRPVLQKLGAYARDGDSSPSSHRELRPTQTAC